MVNTVELDKNLVGDLTGTTSRCQKLIKSRRNIVARENFGLPISKCFLS